MQIFKNEVDNEISSKVGEISHFLDVPMLKRKSVFFLPKSGKNFSIKNTKVNKFLSIFKFSILVTILL